MNWPILSIPVQQPLAVQYMERDPSIVETFYEYHPDLDWEKRAEWVERSEQLRADRTRLTEVLALYNERFNNSQAVRNSIEKLKDERALVVVGGQQGGLFTGPLLVLYKAISIIRMAQEAELKLSRPVVPVFWIAGEDHDFDEVDHTYVVTAEPSVQRIRIEKPDEQRAPVSHVRLDSTAWEAVLAELEHVLPKTEFTPGMLEHLRESISSCATLSDSFAATIGRLFGKYGLVLVDSADEGLRSIEAPMFEKIIQQNDRLEEAYDTSERLLASYGYTPQAVRSAHSANVFVIRDGERHLLQKENGQFVNHRQGISLTQEQLLDIAQHSPQSLSNNVLTRPLMQDYLFPVLATVLGPGEIAYWAQIKQAFRELGMRMPIIWPRMGFTCIEGTLNKLLDKYELTVEDVVYRYEEKRSAWLQSQDALHLDERFETLRSEVDSRYTELLQELVASLPALGKLGATNHNKVLEQIDFLHHRAKDAMAKQHESGLRQWERLHVSLHPLEKPQERVLNMLGYACRYGEDWFTMLMEAPVVWRGEHRIALLS
ncbi:bacillithiol biosynthesis cysteine-adding enzyme BshC [Paenibacillus alvei]|uniref:bacillithiol biosynthesis cysteine-adding enzyme BshC n=1 Tax=Paenibacillus alvei TaxID=44250 RepID=UPI00028A40DE|nr:bacillithiol biosynthesis cysteine-adding enzyme BshC [Paenibacillus alvei]EJW17405.1 hypothetical protein PAV_4c05110 [Paenibacillus alvei DSM 29]MCY9540164.1 bacillithiol biosynthesis cysteine-adding enzyme BshC [Paenibacillus alvei]MCY9705628.1 bacillithiol biosynthesis cysteine-adding enzyme BshC [Paenibacillus alvei]MCY9734862.1 bacillithiol biosynthesis cysteine-adding enzyme BshC [Paenibacillus alvei]MCY9757851.1 bacillithiol biosynthesis cysteine-adding enzyme BshC [Paenibacillus al